MTKPTISDINALLPQTQCGLCGHGGCLPYATALVEKDEAINLCPPGGVYTLNKLGEALNKDPKLFQEDMRTATKPDSVAVVREDECIGCTKCIQACPVDAILGSAKQMHTVIESECTGCELCVAPCPVDCIDIISIADRDTEKQFNPALSKQAKKRYNARKERLELEAAAKNAKRAKKTKTQKRDYIAAALLRAKNKKSRS